MTPTNDQCAECPYRPAIALHGCCYKDDDDQVYCLAEEQWYALVNGREFGPWPDKGSAMAGMETEQRRAKAALAKKGEK